MTRLVTMTTTGWVLRLGFWTLWVAHTWHGHGHEHHGAHGHHVSERLLRRGHTALTRPC
jgi:hypothetical protein